jgi:hypothetical protein
MLLEYEIRPEVMEAAISIVAKRSAEKTGRHIEWIRRRLREAVKTYADKRFAFNDACPYSRLAAPVLSVAVQLHEMDNTANFLPVH